jgi:hypothetical protein
LKLDCFACPGIERIAISIGLRHGLKDASAFTASCANLDPEISHSISWRATLLVKFAPDRQSATSLCSTTAECGLLDFWFAIVGSGDSGIAEPVSALL